jgi:hypothetical protein
VLDVLGRHTPAQPWWLGYRDTGIGTETISYDVPKVALYADWKYVLPSLRRLADGHRRAVPCAPRVIVASKRSNARSKPALAV